MILIYYYQLNYLSIYFDDFIKNILINDLIDTFIRIKELEKLIFTVLNGGKCVSIKGEMQF